MASGGLNQPLFAAVGTKEAQQAYTNLANNSGPIVLELTSVNVLNELGLLESLLELKRPLHVPQSVLDQIAELKSIREFEASRGHSLTVWEQHGQLFRQEWSREEILRSIQPLDEMTNWLRKHCNVSGVTPVEGLVTLHTLLSQNARDSILLAKETQGTLLSEDLRLRALAFRRLGVKGVAAFHLVGALTAKDAIPAEKYDETLVRMLLWNYEFVPITARTLLVAFKLDTYTTGQHIRATAEELANPSALDDSIINIVADFFRELSLISLTPSRKQAASHLILDAIAKRGWIRLEQPLIQRIQQRLLLYPLGFEEIMREIKAWKRARLLP